MGMTPIYEALCAELGGPDAARTAPPAATEVETVETVEDGTTDVDTVDETMTATAEAAASDVEDDGVWIAPERVA